MIEDEYILLNGINYRKTDNFSYCDRCGRVPIINNRCIYCDVIPSREDFVLAKKLEFTEVSHRFELNLEQAARRISAFNSPPRSTIEQLSLF
jgi:hypothetical protein